MVGYEVITSDEKKVGRVTEVHGDNLVVEHGTVLKSRHALPKAFAHADDSAHVVRVTVPKEILLDSPKIRSNGEIDETAVAVHYGLASADEAPPTQGYGEMVADDPAYGTDTVAEDMGIRRAEQERAEIREHGDRDQIAESPALLGDRTKDIRED